MLNEDLGLGDYVNYMRITKNQLFDRWHTDFIYNRKQMIITKIRLGHACYWTTERQYCPNTKDLNIDNVNFTVNISHFYL